MIHRPCTSRRRGQARKRLRAGLLLALIPGAALGGQTGREFLQLCSDADAWTQGYCTGYIAGSGELIDGLLLEEDLKEALEGRAFCLPDGLQKGEVRNLVLDYLRARPEVQDKHITSITWAALIQAYPCSQNKAAGEKER